MARNRVIYQSEAVSVGPSNTTATSLKRVQSCNYNFSLERTDVNQFGELASIERLIIQEPTVAVDLSYYFESSASNEAALGFTSSSTDHMIHGMIVGDIFANEKNIFIKTSAAGAEAETATEGVIGIGNCFLTSWSLEAAVGAIPTVSCAFEGQNIAFAQSTALTENPSVTGAGVARTQSSAGPSFTVFSTGSDIAAIRPGNITVLLSDSASDSLPMIGMTESDLKVQSATVAITMSREPLRKLGSIYAISKELTFPIKCTMSVTAVVGDLAAGTVSALAANSTGAGTADVASYSCSLALKGFSNNGSSATKTFTLKKCKLDSQNITSSIGANKTVVMEFSAQIGKDSGLFMSP